ncbi:citrate transporter [Shewanella sp. 10N.286.52.C2]|uniref:GntP family permease n=1 Tax=unclassified Shewanella TaxID=196818 RepID=UPI000CADECCA|nr:MULTISPECIES: GntP family permease [unclassified Shewanella]MDO6618215.1 GntP family permease [Shewanella sp. 6_MG-2023]MDO6638491.1 GntP family permease [Shewanella sp. 5_MG-2023]PMG29300.1 citrate transporter [Shewanella sp. 10N.286.52.C2]
MALGIIAALAVFIWMAMRGYSIVLASLVCSTIVIITSGMAFDKAMLEYFPTGALGAFTFAGRFFLLFAAGAMFGRLLAATGAANSIANKLVDTLGAERVLIITVLFSALLTYGGVVLFVVIFTMYPLGVQLLQQANVPKRLFTGAIALGIGTFTMTAMPGSPSIHNVISSVSLKTDLFAAAGYGLFSSAIMLSLGLWYLEKQRHIAKANGEGFIPSEKDKLILANNKQMAMPSWFRSVIPIAAVVICIVSPRIISALGVNGIEVVDYANSQPIIWPCMALLIGIITTIVLFPRILPRSITELGQGAEESISPLIATSVVIGFGGVVSHTETFAQFSQWITTLDVPVLLSIFIAASSVSAIVGSSSGGLQIFLGTMAPVYLDKGVDPEILHRVAAMASGGFDSLPHCGAVVAILAITGQTHKTAYKDVGVVTVVFPVIACLTTIGSYWLLNTI